MDDGELAFTKFAEGVKEMGWNIAIPDGRDDDQVVGLIVGTEEYIDAVLSHLPEDFKLTKEKE